MSSALTTRLASRSEVAPGVFRFVFELVEPKKLGFQAGQFITFAVDKDKIKATRRSYSIASRSDRGESLDLVVRTVPGAPADRFFGRLRVGDEVPMTGPHGFFVLAPAHPGDVLFAATGVGLAPVLPMLAELAARPEPGQRLVYWGLRHEADLFLADEVRAACDAAGASLIVHTSQPRNEGTARRGRISAPVLERARDLSAPTFYLVGNGKMVTEVKRGLVAAGFDRKKQIRTEVFFD